MKYVHLTPFKNIKRIKKNGIQTGEGGSRDGVFAVPVMKLNWETWWEPPDFSGLRERYLGAGKVSSTELWKWFARKKSLPQQRFRDHTLPDKVAAIVFSIPPDSWPVHVWFETPSPEASVKAARLLTSCSKDFIFDVPTLEDCHEYLEEQSKAKPGDDAYGCHLYVWIDVLNEKAMGRLWQCIYEDEDVAGFFLQVVIPKPIPPRCIERVVPFYRTNKL